MTEHTSRRQVIAAGLATVSALALAACAPKDEGLADQAADDKGYIAGEGVITQLAVADRKEPIELSGEFLDGTTFDLTDWRGAPVVLNLWYAACPPCRTEAPDLQKVYEEYRGKDVNFLGVNVRDQKAAADAFVRSFELTYPSMLDDEGRVVAALNGVLPPQATPSTVVLDAKGRPAARVVGSVDDTTLSALVDDILNEN